MLCRPVDNLISGRLIMLLRINFRGKPISIKFPLQLAEILSNCRNKTVWQTAWKALYSCYRQQPWKLLTKPWKWPNAVLCSRDDFEFETDWNSQRMGYIVGNAGFLETLLQVCNMSQYKSVIARAISSKFPKKWRVLGWFWVREMNGLGKDYIWSELIILAHQCGIFEKSWRDRPRYNRFIL